MHQESTIILVFSLVVFIITGMLTGIIVLLLQYSKRRHADQLLIKEMEDKYDRELLKTQLEVQEQTLEDISREVHDNIGSLITIAKAYLQRPGPPEERLADVADVLKLLQGHVRGLARALSIDTIRASGLMEAIEQFVEHLRKISHYEILYKVIGNYVLMDEKVEIIAFRILQESINNTLKHAGASRIAITITNNEAYMCICIEDNGKGLDLTAPTKPGGISNIKTRASLIHADLKMETPTFGGTRITLCIPLTQIPR